MRMPVDDATGATSSSMPTGSRNGDRSRGIRSSSRTSTSSAARRPERVDVVPLAPGSPPLDRANWPRAVERVVRELERPSARPARVRPSLCPTRQFTESFYNIGSALRVWRFDPSVPALVRSTLAEHRVAARGAGRGRAAAPHPARPRAPLFPGHRRSRLRGRRGVGRSGAARDLLVRFRVWRRRTWLMPTGGWTCSGARRRRSGANGSAFSIGRRRIPARPRRSA